MQQVFIFGVGFIGSHLVESFSTAGFDVTEVSRYECDLSISDCVQAAAEFSSFASRCQQGDIFIFLSAISSPDYCAKYPSESRLVNVTNTIKLINLLTRRDVRVIFTSSDVVMGGYPEKSYEDWALYPSGAYGKMKASVERACLDNPLVKVARFSYVVGAGDQFTDMLRLASKADVDAEVQIYAGFERNVVSMTDVFEGMRVLATRWEDFSENVFNFSGPKLESREDMVVAFIEVFPDLKYEVLEAPIGFWDEREKRIEVDCGNFSRLLGRLPRNLEKIVREWRR